MIVQVLVGVAAVLLLASALLVLYRIAAGPDGLDRVVASDVGVAILIAAVAAEAIWNRAFWGKPVAAAEPDPKDEADEHAGQPLPAVMVGATLGLLAFSLVLIVAAGPLYTYATFAAEAMKGPSYVVTVLQGVATP